MTSNTVRKCILLFFFAIGIFFQDECYAQKKQDNSVRINDNGVIYELPKAYELMHIAMALTDSSIVSSGYKVYYEVIDTSSSYYKEVIEYFSPYRDHKLIAELNKSLRKKASLYASNVQVAYNAILVDNDLNKQNIMPWARRTAAKLGSVNLKHLEDFARLTKFEQFYSQHRAYYQKVLDEAKRYADVNAQQAWLEQRFPRRYQQYRIVFSPLMYGTHFT